MIFVNGWHGHEGCKYFRLPKSNVGFWKEKIGRNIARDVFNEAELKTLGWKVIRVWECDIKTISKRDEHLRNLFNVIVSTVLPYAYDAETDAVSIA